MASRTIKVRGIRVSLEEYRDICEMLDRGHHVAKASVLKQVEDSVNQRFSEMREDLIANVVHSRYGNHD